MNAFQSKKRQCRICKSTIRGRSDKVFCSPACKNEYHVRLRRATARVVRYTDIILHRNRSILLEILGKNNKQKKVNRLVLDKKKFNYNYLTGYYRNTNNKIYNLIYDFAWMEFKDGDILIIKRNTKPSSNPPV